MALAFSKSRKRQNITSILSSNLRSSRNQEKVGVEMPEVPKKHLNCTQSSGKLYLIQKSLLLYIAKLNVVIISSSLSLNVNYTLITSFK